MLEEIFCSLICLVNDLLCCVGHPQESVPIHHAEGLRMFIEDLMMSFKIPVFTFPIPVPNIEACVVPYIVPREPRELPYWLWVDRSNSQS